MRKIKFTDEKEWLAFRKQHIGCSDIPVLMGEAKWKLPDGRIKTPRLIWEEKLGLSDLNVDNANTRYGKVMENPARTIYEAMVGDLLEPTVVLSEDHSFLMASLDGLNITDDRAVEIKNANAEDHELAKKGKVPIKYYGQLQGQLEVTKLPTIDYFSFHKNEGFRLTIERDEKYIKNMLSKLEPFWENVLKLKEPEMVDEDYLERDEEWKKIADKLFETKQKIKTFEAQEKDLENMLKLKSENKNSKAGGFIYSKSIELGRVNYKDIPELKVVNLEEYRSKPIIKWRLKREMGA